MNSELLLLTVTTASVAFIHTVTGPDHYLPFIVISKAKSWKNSKTILFTALCGMGHVGSSIVLGLAGIALGIAVGDLELWEGVRGSIISYVFTTFGLVYLIWGVRRAIKNHPHTHIHYHSDGSLHDHEHTHHEEHTHVHEKKDKVNITPWILFTIFVFGPCEPLIPLVMYPAAKNHYWQLTYVTVLFSLITIVTMIAMVYLARQGLKFLPLKTLERYNHAIAGGTILLCGIGMLFLGL